MKPVKIFAHRGASNNAPENTIEAFRRAMEQKADGIELDVQLTKDKEIVVIHDEKVDRVSNGQGYVKDYTLEEIQKLDCSCGHDAYKGAKVPALREVLELIRESDMEINIELKTSIIWYPGLEQAVVRLVKEMGVKNRVIYSSFNHYSIQKILDIDPEAETAYLFSDVILDVEKYAAKTGADGIHPPVWHIDMPDFLKRYLESKLKVRVWTVDNPQMMKMLIEAGVEAIITNRPEEAVKIRRELGEK